MGRNVLKFITTIYIEHVHKALQTSLECTFKFAIAC